MGAGPWQELAGIWQELERCPDCDMGGVVTRSGEVWENLRLHLGSRLWEEGTV